MGIKAHYLLNKAKEKFYPYAHADATFDREGKKVGVRLDEMDADIEAAKTHADSAHAPSNAEPNQNAFSNVMIGSTIIGADSTVDTLHLAGSNVTLTPEVDNDRITIGITKENVTSALGYTPPTTDTKVTQTDTTDDADYRIVLSANANDTTETNTLRKSTNFKANPSTGAFYAKGYDRIDITGQTLDINTLTLSTGSPEIMRYIEKTSTGASNITNIPVASQPFILDVELIRWASTSDYVTKQTFVSVGHKAYEYVRYCASGTWDTSWTKRVFTDNNTTYSVATTSANGLMSSTDKTKLDGIATGAEVNVQSDWNITDTASDAFIKNKPTIPTAVAVKGNAESTYRTGNVNLTPANLGITVVNNTADADKNVATAVKATQDASGNVITETYATKAELNNAGGGLSATVSGTRLILS